MLLEAAEDFGNYLRAQITPDMSGVECLQALKTSYFDFYGERQDIFVLIGILNFVEPHFPLDKESTDSDLETPYGKMRDAIASVIQRGVQDSSLSPNLDPNITARLFMLVSTSIIDRAARLPKSKRDFGAVFREIEAVFYLLMWGAAGPGLERPELPEGLIDK